MGTADINITMVSDGARIVSLSEKCAAAFPDWRPGMALPDALLPPEEGQSWEIGAVLDGRSWQVACAREEAGYRFVFQPRSRQPLTAGQMDGVLYRMRTLMGEFYRELAPCVRGDADNLTGADCEEFSRSYYRMLRLMDHMDFLRDAAEGTVVPEQGRVELNELCSRVVLESDGILGEVGAAVEFIPCPGPIFLCGDRLMLRDALLELISNCAKRVTPGGRVLLRLTRRGRRAMLCVTDSGAEATGGQLLSMTDSGVAPRIPSPEDGAYLGLSVVREIVRLHGGAFLVEPGPGAPKVYLSLPTGPTCASAPMSAPRPERNPGMSPYLIALSDVLPGHIIREDWME